MKLSELITLLRVTQEHVKGDPQVILKTTATTNGVTGVDVVATLNSHSETTVNVIVRGDCE